MNVYQLVAEFRINLLRRDDSAQRELQTAYEQAFEAINAELTNTARQLGASGPDASPALLAKDRRLRDLQEQVSEAMAELGKKAGSIATRGQRLAATAAQDQAVQLIETKAAQALVRAGAFNRLPSGVIGELVGVSAKGTPVNIVFEGIARDLGLQAGDRIKRALVQGVTLGLHPDLIARRVRREADARGINPARSPIVVRRLHSAVRNEMFRAYREATRATYQENESVVKKWRWVSKQSPASTCVICWSQDGRTFPLSTPFASHPNCRCVQTPVLEGERERYITGPERFERLEEGAQRAILGDRAFEAFSSGAVEQLDHFVEVVNSKQWGPSRVRRSLDDLQLSGRVNNKRLRVQVSTHALPPRSFATDSEAAAWGKDRWSSAKVTADEAQALRRYQSAGYQNVNPFLRGQKNFAGERAEQYKTMIRQVDSALKHKAVPEDVIAFRAVSADALGGELSENLKGRVFEEKAFMSTALGAKVPREFRNKQVVLKLQVPAGTPGYFMPLVATDARMRAERELLLGRGLKYRITDARYNGRSGKWELNAEILPPTAKMPSGSRAGKTPASRSI